MRQLIPTPIDEVDPLDLYPADARPRPADRPWLMVNMIASVDGATAVDGVSGGLGGPADKAVFRAVRASCDMVLVASATAIAERYRMPVTSPEVTARRADAGRPPAPGLAIVTASGRIDPTVPAFAERPDGVGPPLVITGEDADAAALAELDAEIVRVSAPTPEPTLVLAALAERGIEVVLAEGGPSFNARLHAADMIDELCLSLSPTLVGGTSSRILADDGGGELHRLRLARLLEADGLLFARYVRA
ncbi:MAG: dihydrofolate reductase family protein [Acidimicrobiales bacterium]|nr:dihydrofolate reductase family protein [Acidimicrobiales bacterium]